MKKLSFLILSLIVLNSCTKHDLPEPISQQMDPNLKMASSFGIKLQNSFVTSEVSMNVKTESAQTVTIKIYDISNRVVSKSTSQVKSGDNLLNVYTSALPSSAYRIALYDSNNNLLGITDFNKIN
jgi:hypothetical protein